MPPFTLKKETRVLGIDDGPYRRGSKRTPIVMTVYRLRGYVDGLITGWVDTDGSDSADVIADLMEKSKFKAQIRCIISDGGCLAGFNVLDLSKLHSRTSVPVITASDEPPDTDSVRRALKNFEDRKDRLDLLTSHPPSVVQLPDGKCWIRCEGIEEEAARTLVGRSVISGRTPEPVRISHMVARSISDMLYRRPTL